MEQNPVAPDQTPVESPAPVEDVSQDTNNQPEAGTQELTPANSDTPSGYVPYSRFKEVNKEVKELKQQLQSLQGDSAPAEDSDSLRERVKELEIDKRISQFPELADKRAELDEFLEENASLPLDRAVTLFRAEQGLIAPQPERKGLEKVVAGPKTAPSPKWSPQQIDELQKTDHRKYLKMLRGGEFDEFIKWA